MRASKSKKLAKKKADRYFSKYIRERDTDYRGIGRCVTCNKPIHKDKAHCGHFMSRRYEATRFDPKNCALQCPACNTFNQGRQFEFGQAIDKRYGEGTAKQLEIKSKMKCHRKQYDYEWLSKKFKDKLDELE